VTASAERKIRAAIVGCGRISAYHVAAVQALPHAELVAACDLREGAAAELAAQHGIERVFSDMETMMGDVQPDVIHLTTPPQSHVALARVAAEHGAHMYIEKPFATSVDDAEAIVAAARAANVEVCAGHSRVFDPTFREALRQVEGGDIGRVVSVRAEQGFTYDDAARGAAIPWDYRYDWGIFENLMPHPLSAVCHFLAHPGHPQVTALNLGSVREAAVDELRVFIPATNAIGEISLTLTSPEVNRLEIVGTGGRILVDFDRMTTLASPDTGLPSVVTRFGGNFAAALKLTRSSGRVAAALATGRIKRYMGIRALIAAFYDALREGMPAPVLPEHAILNVRLMQEIREACRDVEKKRMTPSRTAAAAATPPRIVVTGASGRLGGRMVERLSQSGFPARAATRMLSRAKDLPNVEWLECDLTCDVDLDALLAGVQTVFHCAALVGPPGSLDDYNEVNVTASLRLAQRAAAAGGENLVYISSLAVYGIPARGGEVVDERADYDARAGDRGVYTQSKLAAEEALRDYARDHALPRIVLLRPGDIYGPGLPLPVGLLPLPSTRRRPLITGSRHVPVALTYVDNLVDAMLAAAESDVPTGSVYNIVDSADDDQAELSRHLRELSGDRIRPVVVPYPIVWSMMLAFDLLSRVRSRKPGTARFRLRRTLAPLRFPSTAARTELGWQPRVSLREGLSRALSDQTPRAEEADVPPAPAAVDDEAIEVRAS